MVSAFSVPKAKRCKYQVIEESKVNDVPGPGPQNSPKVIKRHDPQYSFGKDQRRSLDIQNPGPGAYEPKTNIINEKHPSYSMLGKKSFKGDFNQLGPGQYEPKIEVAKEKSPAYSLYGRGKDAYDGNPLGPGQYQIKRQLDVLKKHGVKFGRDGRDHEDRRNIPGPGSYQHENAYIKYNSKQNPSYGFGAKIQNLSTLNVPGPGSYQEKYQIYSKIGGIISRDMSSSMKISPNPGPGNYNPQTDPIERKLPSWSLSKSSRIVAPKSIDLGPGQYDHDKNYKSVIGSSLSYHFPHDQKLKQTLNPVPGPGSYDHSLIKSRRNVKIAEKVKDLSPPEVPGPGSYEYSKIDHDSWAKGKGRYSIGKDPRDKLDYGFIPGPGAYDATFDNSKKSNIRFGRDRKLKDIKSQNPGPGQYNLKPFFADVPKYLLPNKN